MIRLLILLSESLVIGLKNTEKRLGCDCQYFLRCLKLTDSFPGGQDHILCVSGCGLQSILPTATPIFSSRHPHLYARLTRSNR